jgi:hypothetical protein
MSSHQAQATLNENSRKRFKKLLHNELTTPELDFPQKKAYTITVPGSGGGLRVSIHNDAIQDTPLSAGDEVDEYYLRDLGIVILDLNPQED